MKTRTFLIGVVLVALLQSAALGKIIFDRASFLKSGREVILETGFVDPRDLFRGHYVTLDLLIERLEPSAVTATGPIRYGTVVYVELTESDTMFAQAVSVTTTYPENPKGPVIKGEAKFRLETGKQPKKTMRIEFPFDRYFAPKLKAGELEKLRRDRKLGVILALDDDGNGAIKGITVDGERIYEEPLF